ncbi:CAP domain-containing protein [Histomonas meleagridis]|uniref:CAP domain-containing protein n=1 Tax=Histomonas meleagridis TaxID=135588 RepID=UPI003559A7E7|nr:CAP domain-containing protein [Histomonas meleagridis]KAH0798662.1 CAP domain-containing protein [Histomonas meleagridis]
MTLRFTVTQSVRATANFPFHPNSGPKRGVGSYATTKIGNGKGPIRGHGKPPEHKDPVYPPLKPSITVSRPKPHTHNVVPIQKNADGSISFIGHEGPKRGFGLGPGVIYHRAIYKPHEGPKRGIGPPPIIISKEVGSKEDQLCLDLVNKFRRENGLWSLQFSKRLSEIAKPHTDDMLNGRKPLGHDGFNERSSQVPSALSTGENVGYEQGYPNPIQTLVDGWIKSPPHRKNLLGNFNQMGCAFSHRGDLWYGTQFFALI